MKTLRKMRGRYLLVLLAMCGLVSSSLGIMTNAGGIFFSPIAAELTVLVMTVLTFSLISLVTSVPQLFKPIAETYGLAETGIVMMSVVLAANTAGKFLLGLMTDRIGVRLSFLIYSLVITAGTVLLLIYRLVARSRRAE